MHYRSAVEKSVEAGFDRHGFRVIESKHGAIVQRRSSGIGFSPLVARHVSKRPLTLDVIGKMSVGRSAPIDGKIVFQNKIQNVDVAKEGRVSGAVLHNFAAVSKRKLERVYVSDGCGRDGRLPIPRASRFKQSR